MWIRLTSPVCGLPDSRLGDEVFVLCMLSVYMCVVCGSVSRCLYVFVLVPIFSLFSGVTDTTAQTVEVDRKLFAVESQQEGAYMVEHVDARTASLSLSKSLELCVCVCVCVCV
jgi:hypothetical protein